MAVLMACPLAVRSGHHWVVLLELVSAERRAFQKAGKWGEMWAASRAASSELWTAWLLAVLTEWTLAVLLEHHWAALMGLATAAKRAA